MTANTDNAFLKRLAGEYAALDEGEQDAYLDYDAMFSKAIKDSNVFITAFTYGRDDRIQSRPVNKGQIILRSDVREAFLKDATPFQAAAVNLPIFSRKAAGNGSFMARPDSDGVLRRTGMFFTDGKDIYPSLSLEALRVSTEKRKGTARRTGDIQGYEQKAIDTNYQILVGEYTIPVESNGIVYLYYRHFCDKEEMEASRSACTSQDYLPAYKFLDPEHRKEMSARVKGKIVLIGSSAEGLKDLRNTALEPFRPGVEIHANVIEQVLQGKYLLRPAMISGVEALFIFTAGLFFIVVSPFIGVLTSVFLCAALVAVAVFGAYWAYVEHGLLVDPFYPGLAVITIFVVSTILSYARAESRRKHIRSAFGMYVAPDVMRELEKDPEKLKLGGETRALTVMFTDIRKFTSISEGLSPEGLIHLINEFLTAMTEIVLEAQGTVDKYIGDAMMSFWNAPRDVEDHARLACRAALAMQSALDPINERLRVRAQRDGTEPLALNAGIGLNTGPCAVGNMGSKQRFAYSALGDAVNLASRLEGQTKYYGVHILMGEETHDRVHDMASLELDLVRVVGKRRPVRIYALLGDENMAREDTFKAWAAAHLEMMTLYRARDFDRALEKIDLCVRLSEGKMDLYYEMFGERIQTLKQQALPENWDGVFIAEGK